MVSDVVAAAMAVLQAEGGNPVLGNPQPLPAGGYNVVHVDTGLGGGYRLSGPRTGQRWRIVVRSAGPTYDLAVAAAEKAKAAFDDVTLTIAGFDCTPMRDESSRPIGPDFDVDPPLYDGVRVWTFVTTPLPA